MNNWHAKMIKRLGNQCYFLSPRCNGKLEIDHIYGRNYTLDHLSESERQRRYEAEERQGLLRVLCRFHNASAGGKLSKVKRYQKINCRCEKCSRPKAKRKNYLWNQI